MADLSIWEKAMGWRKRQMVEAQLENETINYRDVFPRKEYIMPVDRNEVLEEVAKEFEKLTALGDTAASFAQFVRDMKR